MSFFEAPTTTECDARIEITERHGVRRAAQEPCAVAAPGVGER